MKCRILFSILFSFLIAASSMTFGDGDSRKATAAEIEFGKSALGIIAKAVAIGPEDWRVSGTSKTDFPVVYTEINEPMRLQYHIEWQDAKKAQASQVLLAQEMMVLAKKPGFTEKEVNELSKRVSPKDVMVRIEVLTNISSQGINEKISPASPVAGGLTYKSEGAFRSVDWREGVIYVFLGNNWKMGTSGGTYVNFTPARKNASSTVIQNMVVKIQADSKRAEQLIQKIDWEALKKLITQ